MPIGIYQHKANQGFQTGHTSFWNEETRKRVSLKKKGMRLSEQTKRKIAESRKGMKSSPELRKKLSLAHIGQRAWNKGIPASKETRIRMSKASLGRRPWNKGRKINIDYLLDYYCADCKTNHTHPWKCAIVKRKISESRRGKVMAESTKDKLREYRSLQIFPLFDSIPEKTAQEALNELGISFIKHKTIKFGNFYHQVDLFIEPNICIEIDGDYWHNRFEGKIRDMCIDSNLEYRGYLIYRIWEHEILNKNIEV